MKDVDISNASKTVKWVGIILGIAFLVLGAMSLLLKTEDAATKESVIRFAELGLLGLALIVVSTGIEAILSSLSRIEEKTSGDPEDEEDGTDILA